MISDLAHRLRHFRGHGISRAPSAFADPIAGIAADGRANPWYYEIADLGFNYRASDIHCALGLSQLAKLDRFVAARRALAKAYDRALAPLVPLVQPLARAAGRVHGWHLYVVLIDFARAGIDRAGLMRRLSGEGIGTQVHYIPLHRQPYYRRRYGRIELPGAEAFYRQCLSLPLYVGLGRDDVARVADALADSLATACAA